MKSELHKTLKKVTAASALMLSCLPLLPAAAGPAVTPKKTIFTLASSSFRNSGRIPAKFAKNAIPGGRNISPELHWKNPPAGTKSFALICIDMNPVARRWIHWMVINIPPEANSIPENASGKRKMPGESLELRNSFGDNGWGGPQPPKGTGIHKYLFFLFALDTEKISSSPANEKEFISALKGRILAKAVISGNFSY